MNTGPVEAGATIVTSVALAAAQTAVKQQVQYNETIQKSPERKIEGVKAAKAKDSNAGADKAAKNPKSQSVQGGQGGQGGQSGLGQTGLTGIPPQSITPSRGSQVDLRV